MTLMRRSAGNRGAVDVRKDSSRILDGEDTQIEGLVGHGLRHGRRAVAFFGCRTRLVGG